MLRTCEFLEQNIFFHNLPNHFNVVVKFKPGQMRMRVDESWQSWDLV